MKKTVIRFFCKSISPLVALWIDRQEERIIAEGISLEKHLCDWASEIGIQNAEQIRVLSIDQIPLPCPAFLFPIIERLGFPTLSTVGMCMNRGIYLRTDLKKIDPVLKHELVHTLQYQRLAGTRNFIEEYLFQCLNDGYNNSLLEQEAIDVSVGRHQ